MHNLSHAQEVILKIKEIHYSQGASWREEVDYQMVHLCDQIRKHDIHFEIVGAEIKDNGLCLKIDGDSEEIVWMDMDLLSYSHRARFTNLLFLEENDG